jgi:hypothetical protein
MGKWKVNVRLSDASKLEVEVDSEASVIDLKRAIDGKTAGGAPPDTQKIVFRGRILKDDDSLASNGQHESLGPRALAAPRTPAVA